MKRWLGFGLLWTVTVLLASTPLWLTSSPPAELAIDRALLITNSTSEPVTLPLTALEAGSTAHLQLRIIPRAGGETLYLYMPLLNERAELFLNGRRINNSDESAMLGVTAGIPLLTRLPADLLEAGEGLLDIHVQAPPRVRGYLSPLYLGSAAELMPHYRVSAFVFEYLRLMVPAAQLLVLLLVLAGWLYRPEESLFGWLSALMGMSLFSYVGIFSDLLPGSAALLPYAFTLNMSATFILAIIALRINGAAVPRWLKGIVIGLPLACVLPLLGIVSERVLMLGIAAPAALIGLFIALAVNLHGAFGKALVEARLLLMPLLLTVVAAVYDMAIAMQVVDGPIFLSIYYRPLLMIGTAMILMRRLGVSLHQLDNANSYLSQRLSQQESELARLHLEEGRKAAEQVRSEERRRLTSDLHDGLSGHLVSIIALSEKENMKAIEHAAREALEDLRLVIHSMDIEEDELVVALSALRERLERQLKRMRIELHWSTAQLPPIAGVTPTHALNVLRIVQEAITNAVRHGQARCITVRGDQAANGAACITVENDGLPIGSTEACGGSGVKNMRRRSEQLGGELQLEALEAGTRMRLLLPAQLPAA